MPGGDPQSPQPAGMADPALDPAFLDDQLALFRDAPHWYVGYSGGLDSSVLLHLLHRWCRANRPAPTLSAIHINHGLQAGADAWQAHCERFCRGLQVPLVSLRARVVAGAFGPEAAAREARYGLFGEQLQSGEVLFLAHHADDQVETFFLRLLRGAGLQGLAAMPVTRALGCGRLARPLLSLPRALLAAYAAAHQLAFVEDPTNSDSAADRNFLRNDVLPLLEQRWPGYRQTVVRASDLLAGAAAELARQAPLPATCRSELGDPGITLAQLRAPASGGEAAVLRRWLRAAGLPPPDQRALAEFLRQLSAAQAGSGPRLQCGAYTLQRYRDAIYLLPDCAAPARLEAAGLAPGEALALPGAVGRLSLVPAGNRVGLRLAPGERLAVRWRRGGERCRLPGREGRASLKKLLQERGVPPWWRQRVPLLWLGEELLAVGDLWLCESARCEAAPGPGESLWRPRWERNITTAFD